MAGRKNIPLDILVVACLVILTDIFVLAPFLSETPIRTALGLPMVLFLPGYALIAALFPAKDDLDGIERVALSFGLSIAVVPLIGLGLNYTPWGIRLLPILVALSVFTILMCAIAVVRRSSLPEEEQFDVPFRQGYINIKKEMLEKPQSRLDKALSILLVISIIASVVTLTYVIVTPKQGEKFTEYYILGPEGMADNYPTAFELGDSGNVIVGVVNHEYEPINYTMELRLDNRSLPLSNKVSNIYLEHNETWEQPLEFTPDTVGEDMKLQFLLFKEENQTAAYRDLHLWINVSEDMNGI